MGWLWAHPRLRFGDRSEMGGALFISSHDSYSPSSALEAIPPSSAAGSSGRRAIPVSAATNPPALSLWALPTRYLLSSRDQSLLRSSRSRLNLWESSRALLSPLSPYSRSLSNDPLSLSLLRSRCCSRYLRRSSSSVLALLLLQDSPRSVCCCCCSVRCSVRSPHRLCCCCSHSRCCCSLR